MTGTTAPPGFYTTELNRTVWCVPERYRNLTPVAHGAYGSVCAAKDEITGDNVAIKKLSRPFQSNVHAKRTFREIKLLTHMDHENIIDLRDVFSPDQSEDSLVDVYLVSTLMGADMSNILKIQALSPDHVKFLVYQVLRGLKYVHSAGIIHRDLKPSNIGVFLCKDHDRPVRIAPVNEDCDLKILDFGLARQTDDEMTGYVATRWYRAPEIMLNWMRYDQAVDIWSVGCIMAELITRKPLFPGSDHIDQLNRIMKIVGKPGPELLDRIQSEDARRYIAQLASMPPQPFTKVFEGCEADAISLLDAMLQLDPLKRISATDALAHPYLCAYHDPDDEPTCVLFDNSFEELNIPVDEWRGRIWAELVQMRERPPPQPRDEPMEDGDA